MIDCPRFRLIVGHMGEMLPVMLAHIDEVTESDIGHLKRPVSRALLDQLWITTSGMFSEPPLLAALLNRISLAPADKAKLAHGNADALLKLKVRTK